MSPYEMSPYVMST